MLFPEMLLLHIKYNRGRSPFYSKLVFIFGALLVSSLVAAACENEAVHSVFISAAVCRSESTACRVFGERGKGKRKIEWRVIEVKKKC